MRYSKNVTTKILTLEPDTPDFLAQRAIRAEAVKWREVRQRRDTLLSSSDWTQVADSPLNETQKEAWRNYRQALRDIPNNFTHAADVIWPEQPE